MTVKPLFHTEFVVLPVANLRRYERNARQNSAQQLDQIADAVRTFGWTNPVLVDEADMILAGHGRVEAATTRLQLKEVPCLRILGLADGEKRALILADNKIALNATWDEAMVAREIADIRAMADVGELDIDIGTIGFSAAEMAGLDKLLEPVAEPEGPRQIDVTDEPAVCQQGKTWCLGNHRLTVGGGEVARDADLVVRAWERETGEEATLSPSGLTFNAVATSRGIEFVRPAVKSQKARPKAG
jgi:ParB-like chromosome segregation protein Spo0J